MNIPATLPRVAEWRDVSVDTFRSEIFPAQRPAILRGAVAHWPAVVESIRSAEASCAYLRRFDLGRPVQTLSAAPAVQGRFFYEPHMRGLNFTRKQQPLSATLMQLLERQADPSPPATYIESTPITDYLPGFAQENVLALLPPNVAPRIWIGNAVTVQTHFDLNDNIACVVAGRRRFTLFPPDQIANLYVGPFDFTLSGPPVSMVSLHQPDLEQYPRFQQALEAAMVAELEPGDALFIPYFWWHHVQSLAPFNVLVNYWWNSARSSYATPFDALLHSVLAIRELPDHQREAWRAVFDYLVFRRAGEPHGHLPPEHRGLLGPLTPERAREIRSILSKLLSR